MKAVVNKLIPFSAVDGPGNRTALFLQGCNLDCRYCHNPETIHTCKSCGTCVEACKSKALRLTEGRIVYDYQKCIGCDTCIHICPNGSSPKTREMTAEEVCEEVKKNIPFIRGLTVSGGECTLQASFLKELFPKIKELGLSILLDSNGTYDFEHDQTLLSFIDGVMLDVKAFDEVEHQKITGHDNTMILKNLSYLAKEKKLSEVRTVIVPELFDCEKTIRAVAQVLAPYNQNTVIRYKLISYRPMGVRDKYKMYRSPSTEEMQYLKSCLESYGFTDIIII